MKATRLPYFLLLFVILIGCENDDDKLYSNSDGRFVRFNLQLDRNDQPIEFPLINPALPAAAVYEKDNLRTLKIPVSLTSEPLNETVTVDFSSVLSGITNVSITPASTLTFSGTQLVDTIFIKINERIDIAQNPSIQLNLLSSSDPEINMGLPNEQFSLNELVINLNDVDLIYNLEDPSTINVQGIDGETRQVSVNFPNGFNETEVTAIDLFTELQSDFTYSLIQQPLVEEDKIIYTLTINNTFSDPGIPYLTSLQINTIPGYTNTGATVLKIKRDPQIDRDLSTNTASNFYNTADSFYRLFGVNWMDFNEDGICEWRDFNTFTLPVIVDYVNVGDDPYPNGILIDDRGTTDITDDLYYHAFQVGFMAPQNTTNPFNLRRWFNNESTSDTFSPGLNIVPALEFFPDGGNSRTSGTVQVVEQDIIIGTTPANGGITEVINISGSGTYTETSPGEFELIFELNATNNRLFGGTRVEQYHLYNVSNFTDPPLLGIDCATPINL
jgi:hypothetical protein